MTKVLSLLLGWFADLLLGDPALLPHPVVGFGRVISAGEHMLNKGSHRKLKGGVMSVCLIVATFVLMWSLRYVLSATGRLPLMVFDAVAVFYCLAGTTLIREVRQVFIETDKSLDSGRRQVARIVGRDTSQLSAQEVRTAALETLAENLSDGVVSPLFWLVLLGTPGMMAYKMINTLDSMIGYRTERYKDFGFVAARIDDVANYIPARLTSLLMIVGYRAICLVRLHKPCDSQRQRFVARSITGLLGFVLRNGRNHASPNSGYPEAALAAILDCRFGGPHSYFGQLVYKPYIGSHARELSTADLLLSLQVNRAAEVSMIVLCAVIQSIL